MYWERCTDQRLLFNRGEKPTARKEHECCECGRIITIGEKYSYFFGVWEEYDHYGHLPGAYKTCLECEKDWAEILRVFHKNGEIEACVAFGSLSVAIQDAFDAGFLKKGGRLLKEWLDIEPQVNVENLSPEERDDYEKREASVQMRAHSTLLL